MTQRPLGAQISHMLKSRGVDVIFGIPGVHNVEMYRGIEEAGITHVLARHEQGAGFMADGYARASGKPGVAYVITGPGLTNIMTPMGQAYSDSVPLLVISSCLDETAAKRGQLHQLRNQEEAARCVCDWSETARSVDAAYQLVDRAFEEFATRRTRPKSITVPISLLGADAEPAPALEQTQRVEKSGHFVVRKLDTTREVLPTMAQFSDIATRLLRAERPMFIFGGGAASAGGPNSPARKVLAKLKAASFSTYAGRGITEPDDPLAMGAYLARPESAKLINAADCVVIVGTDLSEVDLWRDELGHTAPAIVVNIDPEILAQARPGDTRVNADALDFLMLLDQALGGESEANWSSDILAGYRDRWRAETDAERPGIVAVADALRAAVPEDTMIYSDMTQFAYVAKEVWPMTRPGHWHHPFGYGTLGYGMPAAIGGAVARNGLPTLAICGDSGFQYTLQELGTAVELGLPLPIILWDNGKLKEIEDCMIRSQIAPNAVIAHNPDFVALAKAYGAHASAPTTLEEMQKAVAKAFTADRPTLIHVKAGIAEG